MRGTGVWARRGRRMVAIAVVCAGGLGGAGVAAQDRELVQVASGPRFLMAPRGSSSTNAARWADASRLPVFQRRIALDLRDVPLGQALSDVGRKAGLWITYSPNVVRAKAPVTLSANAITVGAALSA